MKGRGFQILGYDSLPFNFIPADPAQANALPTGRNFKVENDEVERTAFDKWLLKTSVEKILVHFAMPPRNDDVSTDLVTVLQVDENFVLLEFSDGEVFWVQKELISSAGLSG
jgi:hypothetical protein